MNVFVGVGRLTKAPELKMTTSNIPFVNFTLAINRPFKNEQGENETDFIQCIVWRKTAENLAQYQTKGSLVGVQGRVSTRTYESDKGTKYITEIVCNDIQFLESKKEEKQEHNYPKTDEQIDDTFSNDKKYDKPSVLTPNKRREEREANSEDLPF